LGSQRFCIRKANEAPLLKRGIMMTTELKLIIEKHGLDVAAFLDGDVDISEHLYKELYEYYVDEMPYGTAKARDGDPYQWIAHALYEDLR